MRFPFIPKVATSNHLLEGDVIYYASPGWTRDIAKATVAQDQAQADMLLQEASSFPHETVGVVLSNVGLENGVAVATHFRERFRTIGPSNYFHGKQAENV